MFQPMQSPKTSVIFKDNRKITPIIIYDQKIDSMTTMEKVLSPISTQTCNSNSDPHTSDKYFKCFKSGGSVASTNCLLGQSGGLISPTLRTTRIFKNSTPRNGSAEKPCVNPLIQNINIINYGPIQVYCASPKICSKNKHNRKRSHSPVLQKKQNNFHINFNYNEDQQSSQMPNKSEVSSIQEQHSRFHNSNAQTTNYFQQSYTITFGNIVDNSIVTNNAQTQQSEINTSMFRNPRRAQPFSLKNVNFSQKNMILGENNSFTEDCDQEQKSNTGKNLQKQQKQSSDIWKDGKNRAILALWAIALVFSVGVIFFTIIGS